MPEGSQTFIDPLVFCTKLFLNDHTKWQSDEGSKLINWVGSHDTTYYEHEIRDFLRMSYHKSL